MAEFEITMKNKQIQLTNLVVKRPPNKYDLYKLAPSIDLNDYQDIVHHMTREESIAKAQAVVPALHAAPILNLGGIQDDRTDRVFLKRNR